MAHEDSGHYAGKHPAETKIDSHVAEALQQRISEGKITCEAAHEVAQALNVAPLDIGVAIDLLEVKISVCQLGLFGYGPQRKAAVSGADLPSQMKAAIEAASVDNHLSCAAAWDIAKRLGVARTAVMSACDQLKVKLSSCQLGTF